MFDIILPIYRVEPEVLDYCLESIQNQTFTDYEVWIIDGTPTDWKSNEELLKTISKYPSFNYQKQTGLGLSQARNQGIKSGSNPYIALIDGDDFWYPQHLENINNSIGKSNSDIVLWWDLAVYPIELDRMCFMQQYLYEDLELYDDLTEILSDYIILPSTSVFTRQRAEEIYLFDESLWSREDIDFFLRLANGGYQGNFINRFGCIALFSIIDRKIIGWEEKDLLCEQQFLDKHPDFDFTHSKKRYNIVWGDNEEPYPNDEVIELCLFLVNFQERLNKLIGENNV